MSETAYVVTGERGNYSDWTLWLVAGFQTKERADTFCDFIEGFRMGLSAQVKAMFPTFGDMGCDDEEKCFAHIETRAQEIGLSARTAFGIEETYSIDTICEPDGYGNEIKFKVVELPWNTSLAGGIPK